MIIIGGHRTDLANGLKRKYAGRPRPLVVTFDTFVGLNVVGAKHFYLRFKEAEDPYVDCRCEDREPHEHQPWDDRRSGDEWRLSFMSKSNATEALHYIRKMMEGSRRYVLEVDEETELAWQDEGWEETLREQEERYGDDLNPYQRPRAGLRTPREGD